MNTTINLLDMAQQADHAPPLELIRWSANELPVIPFTPEVVRTQVHYCSEDEINSYVRCNEPDCVLCRIGRKQDERLLLPAYLPTLKSIGVLPITPNMQPFSLLPQLFEVLQRQDQQVLFISREGKTKFTVTTSPLLEGMDVGASQIKKFKEKMESETVDLASVFTRLGNKQLAAVPAIAETLRLKGLDPDEIS